MRVRLWVIGFLAGAAILAWGAAASTQVTETGGMPSGSTQIEIPDALEHQMQIQQAHLVEHHELVVDLRERIQQSALDYQERTARQLGDRAPTETIPPMATIAPVETESP